MSSVIISIKPQWCKLIESGEKTLEIRKRYPKCDTPFKAYIYCTFSGENWFSWGKQKSGHIIGEFICDKVTEFSVPYPAWQRELPKWITEWSCVPYQALHRYALASNDCNLFAWHISEYKEYEEPVYITEFLNSYGNVMKHPPQSWAYCIKRTPVESFAPKEGT